MVSGIFLSIFRNIGWLRDYFTELCQELRSKNAERAADHRKEGNKLFLAKRDKQALLAYTQVGVLTCFFSSSSPMHYKSKNSQSFFFFSVLVTAVKGCIFCWAGLCIMPMPREEEVEVVDEVEVDVEVVDERWFHAASAFSLSRQKRGLELGMEVNIEKM